MKTNFQNNVIQYTLINKMSIDDKINEAKKDNVIINKSKLWDFSNKIHFSICLVRIILYLFFRWK